MKNSANQQIIISGVGGQGVLFVTRLLAEAAIIRGLPVFTSETHGMAQRGGTVISHLKVGNFSGPLIRPAQADGLLALKEENLSRHSAYLKPGAWAVVNGSPGTSRAFSTDAEGLAQKIGNPKSVNLVLLGFAFGKISETGENKKSLFCSADDIRAALEIRLSGKSGMLEDSLKSFDTGYRNQ